MINRIKFAVLLSFIILLSIDCFTQSKAGVHINMNWDNINHVSNDLRTDEGFFSRNIQFGVFGQTPLHKKLSLGVNLLFSPRKSIPLSQESFDNFIREERFRSIRTAVFLEYAYKNISIGIGPSYSKFINREERFSVTGWEPSPNKIFIGTLFKAAYTYKNFQGFINYRIERCNRKKRYCGLSESVKSIELGVAYLFFFHKK